MGYDGIVTIKTALEEKGIDKGIASIETKMEKLRKKAEAPYEINGVKITGGWNLSKEEQQYYDRLEASLNKLQLQKAEIMMADKQITQEVKEQTEAINQQIPSNDSNKAKIVELSRELEEMLNNYNAMKNQDIVSSQDLKDAKELRKEILRVKKEYEKLTGTKLHIKGITNTKKDFSDIGNSISGTIKKVGKWALAIFSIRSAYTAIRNAMSTLSQYNEQLANKLNTIKLVFASALEPVVTRLVDLVFRLLTYVNYIAKAWFNVDLFASASAKAMKNGASSAEKMRKSMAGFDEMNVVSDNSGGSASVGSGFVAPEDAPIPSWIKWIADNKDLVIGGLVGIGTALLLLNLGGLLTNLTSIGTILSTIWGFIQPLFTFIGANAVVIGGIILIIGGLAIAIKGVIDYLNNPTWENFGIMLTGIGIIASGVFLIFGGFPALITLIVGAIVALGVAIYKNWDKIVAFTKELVQKIKDAFGNAINWIKEKFNSMVSFFGSLISKIVGLFKTIGTKVGNAIGGAFKTVINGVLKAIETILNKPINAINNLLDVINAVPGINLGKLPTFNLPRLAVGGIVNMPSRGVPIGGAIAGEAGVEGVIPLTNSQAMETLGQAIGKYVTINANITNTMNGRVISRELQKVNSSSDFAFNR